MIAWLAPLVYAADVQVVAEHRFGPDEVVTLEASPDGARLLAVSDRVIDGHARAHLWDASARRQLAQVWWPVAGPRPSQRGTAHFDATGQVVAGLGTPDDVIVDGSTATLLPPSARAALALPGGVAEPRLDDPVWHLGGLLEHAVDVALVDGGTAVVRSVPGQRLGWFDVADAPGGVPVAPRRALREAVGVRFVREGSRLQVAHRHASPTGWTLGPSRHAATTAQITPAGRELRLAVPASRGPAVRWCPGLREAPDGDLEPLCDPRGPAQQLAQHAALDGNHALAAITYSVDGRISVWDLDARRVRHRLAPPGFPVRALALSPPGTALIALGEGVARVWRLAEPDAPPVSLALPFDVVAGDLDPAGRSAALVGRDGLVRLVDLHTRAVVATLLTFDDGSRVVVAPDGRFDDAAGESGWHLRVGGRVVDPRALPEAFQQRDLLRALLEGEARPDLPPLPGPASAGPAAPMLLRLPRAQTVRTPLEVRVPGAGVATSPVWSPEGTAVAFEVARPGGNQDLYVASLQGRTEVRARPAMLVDPSGAPAAGAHRYRRPSWQGPGLLFAEVSLADGPYLLAELRVGDRARTLASYLDDEAARPFPIRGPVPSRSADGRWRVGQRGEGTVAEVVVEGPAGAAGLGPGIRPVVAGERAVWLVPGEQPDRWGLKALVLGGEDAPQPVADDVAVPVRAGPAVTSDGAWVAYAPAASDGPCAVLVDLQSGRTASIRAPLVRCREVAVHAGPDGVRLALTAVEAGAPPRTPRALYVLELR